MKLTEKLTELLGEEVFETIKDKLDNIDDTFLDVNDSENKIPKERLDKEIKKRKDLESKIEELSKDSSNLEEKDNKIKELSEMVEKFETERKTNSKNKLIEQELKKVGAKDMDYLKFKLGNLELKEDGTIEGLEEKVKTLKEDESLKSFFTQEKVVGFEEKEEDKADKTINKPIASMEDIKKMSKDEIRERMNEIDDFLAHNK